MLHGIGHLFEGLCNLSSEIVHSVTENSLGISQDEITFSKTLFFFVLILIFFVLFCDNRHIGLSTRKGLNPSRKEANND